MGLLGFLRRKKVQQTIKLDEIEDWLDSYIERQEIGTKIGILRREIKAKLMKLKEHLDELENAGLANEQVVPERAKNVMEGNRRAYILRVRQFMNEVTLPDNYNEIKPFMEEIAEKLENLATDTQKNYYIIKEFMEDHARPVSNKLSEFDKLFASSIEMLDKTALDKVRHIKEKVRDYYNMQTEIQRLRKEAEKIEKDKLELYEKRDKIENKINRIKKSSVFEEFTDLKEKQKETEAKLKRQQDKFSQFIADIDAAMKKQAKRTGSKKMKKYLDGPVEALLEDKSLDLLEELQKLLKNIDKLELKDTKKKRVENTIKECTKEEIEKLRNNIIKFTEENDNLKRRVKNHTANMNIKEESGFLENIDDAISKEEKKMEDIEDQLERLNPNLIKQKIKGLLKELEEGASLE